MNKSILLEQNALWVGRELYSMQHGKLTTSSFQRENPYPIWCIDKKEIIHSFTDEGRFDKNDLNPTLFTKNSFNESDGRVILVRNSRQDSWIKRVFIKVLSDNSAVCWDSAETIENAEYEVETTAWKYWKEYKEEEELVHLTLKDISEGKGKGISSHLLRIKE